MMTHATFMKDRQSGTMIVLFCSVLLFLCLLPSRSIGQIIEFDFDFHRGAQQWTADFANYPPATNTSGFYQLTSGIRLAPRKLTYVPRRSFYIQGSNHSASLIMFLKRRLGASDGIVAGRTYRVEYMMKVASNAASRCVGIGSPPGEGVFLRAGASPVEPKPELEANGWLRLNVDLATATTVTGDIANGLDCELAYPIFPYVYIHRQVQHPNVTATTSGELWLLVGTISGFEGLTGLYYQNIKVRLVPV